jgi:protein-tyrosine sulfotransferase
LAIKLSARMLLKRKYDPLPLWLKTLERITGSLASGIFHRYPLADQAGSLSCQPLLIISSGRSGTTLLRSMLVAGGQIAIPPETQFLHRLPVKFLSAQGLGWQDLCHLVISSFESHHHYFQWETNLYSAYNRTMSLPEKERSLARIIDIVFTTYAEQRFPAATVWGDQSPVHTFYLSWIKPVFPRAKFLHLVRDGRDVISSMVERRGPAYLEEAVYRWMKSIECVRTLRKSSDSSQLLEVRYEDLVSQPTETLRKVSEYAGITYSPKMLDYWKLPSTIEYKYHVHHRNLSRPVFASSVGKWRDRLTPEQQKYVMSRVSTLLESLGYEI